MKQKNPNDVRGKKIKCPNFCQCPLCYGCRNYNSAYLKCQGCKLANAKQNICNTKLHRADLIDQMITKEEIVIS